jgi:hypothetical protein
MNLLLLLPLAIPFGCLALLSLLAFLGVLAVAGALPLRTAQGICADGDDLPCRRRAASRSP